jgi:outer membrane murein-binding lipoprotein Lpp
MYKYIVFGFLVLTGCASTSTVSLQSQVKAQDVKIDLLEQELDKYKDSRTEHVEVAAVDTLHWVFEHAVSAWESETSVETRASIKEWAIKSFGEVSEEFKVRAGKCFDDIVSSKDGKALSCFNDLYHG